jgi:hypothetical protein
MLKPGHNDIRYDALVAVSSTPENQGAPGVLPVPVYELPAELLRYTLPDSDKDSGQKPRRSLHERDFHANVIRKCSALVSLSSRIKATSRSAPRGP